MLAITLYTLAVVTTNYNNSGGTTSGGTSPGTPVGVNMATNPRTRVVSGIGGLTRGRNLGVRIIRFSSCMAPGMSLTRNRLFTGSVRRTPCLTTALGGRPGFRLIRTFGAMGFPVTVCSAGCGGIRSVPTNTAVNVPGSPSGNTHTLLILTSGNFVRIGSGGSISASMTDVAGGPGGCGVRRLSTTSVPGTVNSLSVTMVGTGCTLITGLGPSGSDLLIRHTSGPFIGVFMAAGTGRGSPHVRRLGGVCASTRGGGFVRSRFGNSVAPTF